MGGGFDEAWSDVWGLGHAEIDAEHRKLFDLCTAIRASLERGQQPDCDLRTVCKDLIADTAEHFRREEAMMEAADYPDREAHRKLHQSFMSQMDEIWTFVREGDDPDDYLGRFLVLGFVGKWLSMHIAVVDRKFADFLKMQTPGA
ncbi:bacteriohemerythrin [Azospirillum sp. sgz302134]